MPRSRDTLQRFRPAGTPGAASAAGIPVDRVAEPPPSSSRSCLCSPTRRRRWPGCVALPSGRRSNDVRPR